MSKTQQVPPPAGSSSEPPVTAGWRTPAAAAAGSVAPPGMAPPEAGGAAAPPAAAPVKAPRKRPCFNCGTMTRIQVLEKTGDLCWRCYRPAGYNILKVLMLVAVLIVATAASIIGYRMWAEGEGPFARWTSADAKTDGPSKDFTPEQKIAILQRHFRDGVSVGALSSEYEVSQADLNTWIDQSLKAVSDAFAHPQAKEPVPWEKQFATIEQKLQMMSKLMAEMREEVTRLRKESGQYEAGPSDRYILQPGGPPPQ